MSQSRNLSHISINLALHRKSPHHPSSETRIKEHEEFYKGQFQNDL